MIQILMVNTKWLNIDTPGLTNIAGTILNLLGYENVEDYDKSLIEIVINILLSLRLSLSLSKCKLNLLK